MVNVLIEYGQPLSKRWVDDMDELKRGAEKIQMMNHDAESKSLRGDSRHYNAFKNAKQYLFNNAVKPIDEEKIVIT